MTFIFKFKDSNGIHWQVYNALEPSGLKARSQRIRGGRTIAIVTISRGVGNGGRLPFAKICQGALAYSLILCEMQRIANSPIAFVGVCPYVCVCVCMCACFFGFFVYILAVK